MRPVEQRAMRRDLTAAIRRAEAAAAAVLRIESAPVAVVDTQVGFTFRALDVDDYPALYALQGQRVRLVVEG